MFSNKKSFPGKIITLLCVISSYIFIYFITSSKMITTKLMWLSIIMLLLFVVGIFFLTVNIKKKVRFILGCLLALILMTVQVVGSYYIKTGVDALDKITTPKVEYAEIGVFVREDDKAMNLSDTKDYMYGVLETHDRDATNIAMSRINQELGCEINTTNYKGVVQLLDGLLESKSVDVIILNKSFLELVSDISGHEKDAERIREIYSIKIEDNMSTGSQNENVEESDEVFSLFISGIDGRGSLARKSRSDVNILATVNMTTGQILLISTPRDYYVPLSISGGIPDKLTHAGIYGVNVSKDTIAMLYKTKVDYYFKVNFDGFKEIIDALGGVVVKSNQSFTAGEYSFKTGENKVDGKKALAFSRERYSLAGGDRQRGIHQMEVIRATIQKLASPALLKNYTKVLDGLADSFETSVPYKKIAKIVQNQLDKGTRWNVTSFSVDGTGASKKPYSLSTNAYVMLPKKATVKKAIKLIEQVRNGEVPRP